MPPFSPSGFNKAAQRAGKGIDAPVDEAGHALLHVSAENGDADAVARLLRLGANPRQLDAAGQTPLYAAVAAQNIGMVKLLVDHGASFRAEDDAGQTPLLWAIGHKADAVFLDQLYALGMELDFQGKNGRNALQAAAANNNAEVIDYLLNNGALVDEADAEGKTALHLAVDSGAHDAARLLLARGADPLIRTGEIKTPLYLAAAKGDAVAVDLLLAEPAVRRTLNDFRSYTEGFSPLMAAVAGNHLAVAETLLDVGAHINDLDHQNRHSLFIAVEYGHPKMADMLIGRGADVEKGPRSAERDQSMLHKINAAHYKELLTLLYRAGADLNATDSLGQTALYKATDFHEKEKILALLELGADPDLANGSGRRPIDAALASASYYFPEAYAIASALLQAHANPNLSPAANVTSAPLHHAARSGHAELVRLLLSHGAIVDEPDRGSGATPWLAAVGAYDLQACALLRQKGADTAIKDNQLRSVLHVAAQSGALALLEDGLRHPALQGQVDTPDAAGSTPLHIATWRQKSECARTLLAAGANPLTYDGAGLNALHHAARNYGDNMLGLFEMLLGKKADWNTQTRDEKETPLHLAAKIGAMSVVARLLKLDVDVNLRDRRGVAPLQAAVAVEQHGAMKMLIEHMKLKNISLDEQRDNAGWAPLHQAAASLRHAGAAAMILLDAGADVNLRTPEGDTPLHIAARSGRLEVVRMLLARGADVTLANKFGATPLDQARDAGAQSLVDLLQLALKDQLKKAQVVPPSPTPPTHRPPPAARNRPSPKP